MPEKTKNNEALGNDYEALYQRLKQFVKKQIKEPKWKDKTAVEAWSHLELSLDFWETCQTKRPTSWSE